MNTFGIENPLYRSSEFLFVGKHPSFSESNVYENKNEEFALTHPLPNSQQIIEFYESGFYIKDNSLTGLDKRLQFSYQRALAQINFIEPFIQEYPNPTALDIGCSEGSLLVLLQERGFTTVTGYEPDTKMANFANERLAKHNDASFTIKNEVFGHTELEENSYDLVCSSHIFEHLPNPIVHLKQLKPLLKENGTLFMEIPNQYGLGVKNCITPSIFPSAKIQGHLYFYSPNSIKKILEDSGFKVTHIITCGRNIKDVFANHKKKYSRKKISIIKKLKNKFQNIIKSPIVKVDNQKGIELPENNYISQADNNFPFETYWEGDQQGQWIRLIAKPD